MRDVRDVRDVAAVALWEHREKRRPEWLRISWDDAHEVAKQHLLGEADAVLSALGIPADAAKDDARAAMYRVEYEVARRSTQGWRGYATYSRRDQAEDIAAWLAGRYSRAARVVKVAEHVEIVYPKMRDARDVAGEALYLFGSGPSSRPRWGEESEVVRGQHREIAGAALAAVGIPDGMSADDVRAAVLLWLNPTWNATKDSGGGSVREAWTGWGESWSIGPVVVGGSRSEVVLALREAMREWGGRVNE